MYISGIKFIKSIGVRTIIIHIYTYIIDFWGNMHTIHIKDLKNYILYNYQNKRKHILKSNISLFTNIT